MAYRDYRETPRGKASLRGCEPGKYKRVLFPEPVEPVFNPPISAFGVDYEREMYENMLRVERDLAKMNAGFAPVSSAGDELENYSNYCKAGDWLTNSEKQLEYKSRKKGRITPPSPFSLDSEGIREEEDYQRKLDDFMRKNLFNFKPKQGPDRESVIDSEGRYRLTYFDPRSQRRRVPLRGMKPRKLFD